MQAKLASIDKSCQCAAMTPTARISAVIDILADLDARPRPVNDALKDWALSHRFAGSGDRAGIGALAHDALRKRNSARWIMGSDSARATVLGMLQSARGMDATEIAALCDGSRFSPEPLNEAETAALSGKSLDGAPDHIRGDYPEWLSGSFAKAFGTASADEGRSTCAPTRSRQSA
jgi:16S rRNA (cytosine967-C5)-methyltransferase